MQVRPYGYLYRLDGQGHRELAVDFRAYRRSAWDAFYEQAYGACRGAAGNTVAWEEGSCSRPEV